MTDKVAVKTFTHRQGRGICGLRQDKGIARSLGPRVGVCAVTDASRRCRCCCG